MDANEKRRLFMEMKALKQNRLNEEIRGDYTSSVGTSSESNQTIQYDDGRKYVGNLDGNGKPSGKGTIFFVNGARLDGLWKAGKPVHGTWYYPNGSKYEGDFDEEWQRSGQGTMYYANGEIRSGLWEADKLVEEACDTWIQEPVRATDKPFLMPVEDVFSITGRGTVATGRIETGVVKVGDEVQVIGFGEEKKAVITGIEMFRQPLDKGEAGDNVGLLLRGIENTEVKRGMVICKSE